MDCVEIKTHTWSWSCSVICEEEFTLMYVIYLINISNGMLRQKVYQQLRTLVTICLLVLVDKFVGYSCIFSQGFSDNYFSKNLLILVYSYSLRFYFSFIHLYFINLEGGSSTAFIF